MSPLPPSPPGPSDVPGERSASNRRRAGARVLLVSLAVSALLHLVVALLFPTIYVVAPGSASSPGAVGEAPSVPGMEVVGMAEVLDAEPDPVQGPEAPEESEVPETPEEPEEPAPPDEPPEEAEEIQPAEEPEEAAPGGGAPDDEDAPTVAERLRTPTIGDARLWRPVDPDLAELTPDERALIGIYIRLRNMADSTLAAQERERQAREWVFTDDEGRRWGISPGTIYLGDDSVQVPYLDRFQLSAPPSVEGRRLQWELDDIRRGAETARIRDAWDERRDAIRERRDAEREEARDREERPDEPADTTGSGS